MAEKTLQERLRENVVVVRKPGSEPMGWPRSALEAEAADALDRLERRIAELESSERRKVASLQKIRDKGREHPDPYVPGSWYARIANAALAPKEPT